MKHKRLLAICSLLCLSISGCDMFASNNKNSISHFSKNHDDMSSIEGSSNDSSEDITGPSASKEEVLAKGNELTKEICEEGMVLLKNEDQALPLRQGSKVSVFGKNSVNPVYGGSGSASPTTGSVKKRIFDSLDAEGIEYNPVLKEFYENDSLSGKGRSINPVLDSYAQLTLNTGETPYFNYTDAVLNSYNDYSDAALVVISRIGGENFDLPKVADDNENRHYLELDNNERDLIRNIGQSGIFDKIVLLLNSSNNIDLGFLYERTNSADYNSFGKYIDSVLLVGGPGANGFMALGEILTGKVNPSGHLTETMYTNYKNDPVYQNFGEFIRSEANYYIDKEGESIPYYLTEYEENMYMGYRYYETRGHIDGEEWYQSNVVYPFGYGLSYTDFVAQVMETSTPLRNRESFVEVRVRNVGNIAGKEVIQLYVETPYKAGGIEKPYKTLIGFAKTSLLQPGEEEMLRITFNPYDFASFDAEDKNSNGFKGYELDAGDYIFHVGSDAHNDIGTLTMPLSEAIQFTNDPVTNTQVQPLFAEETEHMKDVDNLSRTNFVSTFPKSLTEEERRVNDNFINRLESFRSDNDEDYTEMPTVDQDKGISFNEMSNRIYSDEYWDDFISQLSISDMLKIFNEGCYQTAYINKYDIPPLICSDGPVGFVSFLGDPSVYNVCYYCSEALLAQTYNVELANLKGIAMGEEALIGDERNSGRPYSILYAPALTLKRSPFCGRNTEYYSEDPYVTGKFAASFIKGAQSKGLTVAVKNFALNEQETSRSNNGLVTWCHEQAIRELYLKPFEMAVKEGNPRAFISSFNRIGVEWTGGSYRLITKILRNEWGFKGLVRTEFITSNYMNAKQALYAGNDILCAGTSNYYITNKSSRDSFLDETNPKDVTLLKRAVHNVLYVIANSNAMVKFR